MGAGSFEVIITDANGCNAMELFDIAAVASLNSGILDYSIACEVDTNGQINLLSLLDVGTELGGFFALVDTTQNAEISGATNFIYNEPGCYEVSYNVVIEGNAYCNSSSNAFISITEQPEPDFFVPDQICFSAGDEFTFTPIYNADYYTTDLLYNWSLSSTSPAVLLDNQSGQIEITGTGTVELTLTETLSNFDCGINVANPCTEFVTQYIVVEDGTTANTEFSVSNFTPCINETVDLIPNINGGIFVGVGVTDNGLGSGATFTANSSGVFEITYLLNSSSGCTNQSTLFVEVDLDGPIIVCPNDTVVEVQEGNCGTLLNVNSPITLDNCGITSITNNYAGFDNASGVYYLGATNVTYLVTDIAGNTNTCTFEVTIIDTEDPVLIVPDTLNINCILEITNIAFDYNLFDTSPDYTLSDNCQVTVEIFETTLVDPECSSTIQRTFVATDESGNETIAIQIINYTINNLNPEFTCENNMESLGCFSSVADIITNVGLLEACETVGDECTNTSISATILLNGFPVSDINAIQESELTCDNTLVFDWIAVDNCGNIGFTQQFVDFGFNNLPPTIDGVGSIQLGCVDPLILPDLLNPNTSSNDEIAGVSSTSDECDSNLEWIGDIDVTDNSCGTVITRLWKAFDDCGNESEFTQTITYTIDGSTPTIITVLNESLGCYGNLDNLLNDVSSLVNAVSVIDGCNDAVLSNEMTLNGDQIFTVSDINLNNLTCSSNVVEVTWFAEDACGNFNTINQVIDFKFDDENPILQIPENNINCNNIGIPPAYTTALQIVSDGGLISDNCTNAGNLEFFITETSSIVGSITSIVRIYSIIDECGNSTTVNQEFTTNSYIQSPLISNPNPICIGEEFGLLNLAAGNYSFYPDLFGGADLVNELSNCITANYCAIDNFGIDNTIAGTTTIWVTENIELPQGNGSFVVCQSSPSAIVFEVLDAEAAALTEIEIAICEGELVELNDYLIGNPNGTWTGPGVGGSTFNSTGLTPASPVKVYFTTSNGSCATTVMLEIVIFENEFDAAWTAPDNLCGTVTTVNLNTYVNGDLGGVWYGDGINDNAVVGDVDYGIFAPIGFGTYLITYGSPPGLSDCSAAALTLAIAVYEDFDASFLVPNNLCGTEIDLTEYITGTPGGTFTGQGVANNIYYPLSALVDNEITYTVGSSICEISNTQIVNVVAEIEAPFVISPSEYCFSNGIIQLQVLDVLGLIYNWYEGPATIDPIATGNIFNATNYIVSPGVYTFYIEAVNNDGCTSARIPFYLDIYTGVNVSNVQTICNNDGTYSVSYNISGGSGSFSIEGQTVGSGPFTSGPISITSNYTETVSDLGSNCNSEQFNITPPNCQQNFPNDTTNTNGGGNGVNICGTILDIELSETHLCNGENLLLTITLNNANANANQIVVSNQFGLQLPVQNIANGVYNVNIAVTNQSCNPQLNQLTILNSCNGQQLNNETEFYTAYPTSIENYINVTQDANCNAIAILNSDCQSNIIITPNLIPLTPNQGNNVTFSYSYLTGNVNTPSCVSQMGNVSANLTCNTNGGGNVAVCTNDAGNVSQNIYTICADESILVTPVNSTVDVGSVMAYALHSGNSLNANSLLEINYTGIFSNINGFNLYVSIIVGEVDLTGFPSLTDNCTDISVAVPVIITTINCDDVIEPPIINSCDIANVPTSNLSSICTGDNINYNSNNSQACVGNQVWFVMSYSNPFNGNLNDVVYFDQDGYFENVSCASTQAYVSTIIGTVGANGFPDLTNPNTVYSTSGATLTIIPEIEINIINEDCNINGTYNLTYSIAGGYGDFVAINPYSTVMINGINYGPANVGQIINAGPFVQGSAVNIEVVDVEGCTESINYVPDCTSGRISRANIQEEITIFPNPTNGLFTVYCDDCSNESFDKIEVYNAIGELLLIKKVNEIENVSNIKIDISEYVNGIYFVKTTLNKQVKIRKVLKN